MQKRYSSFSGNRPGNSRPYHGNNSGRFGFHGNQGGRNRQFSQGRRIPGTTINVGQLINKVQDSGNFKPVEEQIGNRFEDFKIDVRLKTNITQKGYTLPTPIQDRAIPVGLEGFDVIGIANTGTGKTAAFLLPILNKMLADRTQRALILAPTRELATQIREELHDYSKGLNITAALCIGGSDMGKQIRMLKTPVNFVIGTPGRLLDLMKRRLLQLSGFKNVVLDEADRMVDMGFIKDIRMILGQLPRERQSFFFTATMDAKVEELISQFTNDPVKISVKKHDTASNIEQDIVYVPNDKNEKLNILMEHLAKPGFDRVLVFGRTKHGVDKISKTLSLSGIRVDCIHGNKTQNYRQKALNRFKSGDVKVLVATDVAARGLDINAVSHVINFDLPSCYDDYVHRIGRTGRADMKGKALTFVTKG